MILQIGDDHFEVVQVRFGPDEAGDVVHHERIVAPGQSIAERFGRRHIDAVVFAIREFAPLPRLEIHELFGDIAQRPAGSHRAIGLVEKIDRDVELCQVCPFGPRQALKHDFYGGAGNQASELRLHVCQHANLSGDPRPFSQAVEVRQNRRDIFHAVDCRVNTDQCVARTQR